MKMILFANSQKHAENWRCPTSTDAAEVLARLYVRGFGGKASGRYRIPRKLLQKLCGKRRLYEEDIMSLARVLLEKGYVLIDMDSFFRDYERQFLRKLPAGRQ
ncbi:hypothetical protein [Leisingera methylohalidivorans]|uniref:Uncharacterized protein n=1 Tax=Leisingera methylohalidivorans DSM 14336 TaxID=999552 RepID=V9W1J6_9RHOB|nr:hypothetical protein [Leisingera methylohalidivorans]AHD03047.1 hypothetical protein METH_09580 [Leisingera methylohalidivorans DSM 14336]